MSSRAASGRKKLAKAASTDAKNTPVPPTRHSGNSLPSPPIKQSTFFVANPSPSVSNDFDPPPLSGSRSPSALHDRPASPSINADENRVRSPLKILSGRSSGSTSLPQSPLRMESSLSPSVEQALQTRVPNAAALGVQPPRHSPLPPSSPRSASLSTLDEQSTSQSGSSSSGSFASSHSSPSSLRANAPSSTFSSSSGSTESQTSPTAFVFPSSRSRAHPNLTASGKVPKLKLKSKKNKGKEAQRTSYSPSTTSGSSGATVHHLHPLASSPDPQSRVSVPPRISSRTSTSPTRRTSSDISPGFIFPSSRSRAHPSGPPSKLRLPLKKKKSKSSSTGSSSAEVAPSEGEPSRSRFMGIPINKKKKLADPVFPSGVDFRGADAYSPMRRSFDDVSLIGSGFGPYEESIRSSWTPTPLAAKRDVYPLDPYDGVLVEQDRLTTGLLRRLNACDSPAFHHYGTNPPVSVLDLGCGQGDWVLDAAATWKGYGTRVTGFDMVDITRSLRPAAVKHGVVDNIQFVRGNFLQEALPFPDESFDLVRMAGLTYAISFEKWEFVLKEACRVLTVGGRLEMIDDHIFFPYGRAPQAPHPYDTIPEEDDDDPSDSATLTGARRSTRHGPTPSASTSVVPVDFEADQWIDQASAARELESLFEHMHNMKFGIHLCPTQFIVDMMEQVLGHANEIRTMHLTLAPPNPDFETTGKEGHSAAPTDEGTHPLLNAPGLMLWPSTFIPMAGPEIEVHALKHPRVLLSLKNSLAEYALEIADAEEVDEAAVKESLWEYEGFLRERFNPPQFLHSAPTSVSPRPVSSHEPASTWHSRHGSQGSVSSVSSEGRDALQEYQTQLRDHIIWETDSGSDESVPPTPRQSGTPTREFEIPDDASSTAHSITSLPSFSTSGQSFVTTATSMHVPPPPDYSKYEQTHIRTFHVFEAIKMDETLLGAAI